MYLDVLFWVNVWTTNIMIYYRYNNLQKIIHLQNLLNWNNHIHLILWSKFHFKPIYLSSLILLNTLSILPYIHFKDSKTSSNSIKYILKTLSLFENSWNYYQNRHSINQSINQSIKQPVKSSAHSSSSIPLRDLIGLYSPLNCLSCKARWKN